MESVSELREIPGYERWLISPCGDVFKKVGKGLKKVKPYIDNNGYLAIRLRTLEGKQKFQNIHRLVALAYIGPCPAGREVAHWDGNKLNNAVINLRYATRQENMRDKRRHGVKSKLTIEDARVIRERLKTETATNIAREYGTSIELISQIGLGKVWQEWVN